MIKISYSVKQKSKQTNKQKKKTGRNALDMAKNEDTRTALQAKTQPLKSWLASMGYEMFTKELLTNSAAVIVLVHYFLFVCYFSNVFIWYIVFFCIYNFIYVWCIYCVLFLFFLNVRLDYNKDFWLWEPQKKKVLLFFFLFKQFLLLLLSFFVKNK
jgi:Flp pilus assembly protein TadB